MKKAFLVLVTVLFCNEFINAQEPFTFGIKGGVNFSTISDDFFENAESRTGIHFGIAGKFKLNKRFSIQPEVLFSNQGFRTDSTVVSTVVLDSMVVVEETFRRSTTLRLNYINVPVLLNVQLTKGLQAQIGPQIGFNINARIENEEEELDLQDIESVDFSGIFGLQYELKNGLFFQARYNLGFTDVTRFNSRNRVFGISIGYFF